MDILNNNFTLQLIFKIISLSYAQAILFHTRLSEIKPFFKNVHIITTFPLLYLQKT